MRRLLLLLVALPVLPATAARAADLPSVSAWVADGPVTQVLPGADGKYYAGGAFKAWGPRLGSGVVASADTGAVAKLPDINGSVLASAPDGHGGTFIGGAFTSVGGVARGRLAHLLADGTLDPAWNPNASAAVRAIAVSGDAVYVGGDFTGAQAIGGQTRSRLAKLSATTGALDPTWGPSANGSVRTLVATDSAVFVGGAFANVSGPSNFAASRLVKVSASTGDPDATWSAQISSPVNALVLAGTTLYAGGQFNAVNGTARTMVARMDAGGTGALDATWNPPLSGTVTVNALAVSSDGVFVGGAFLIVDNTLYGGVAKLAATGTGAPDAGWRPGTMDTLNALLVSGSKLIMGGDLTYFSKGDAERSGVAMAATTGDGTVTSWNPDPRGIVNTLAARDDGVFVGGDFATAGPQVVRTGGLVRLTAAGRLDGSFAPDVKGTVNALVRDGSNLWVGGAFPKVGAQTRSNLARFDVTGTGAPDAWGPAVGGEVKALALAGGALYIGGAFSGPSSVGTFQRNGAAKLDAGGTGAVDPTWNPDVVGIAVNALAVSGSSVILGGAFGFVGGTNRTNLAKVAADGAGALDATWAPGPGGDVFSLVADGANVYAGGAWTAMMSGIAPRVARIPFTGDGTPDSSWIPVPDNSVYAIAPTAGGVWVGGTFGKLGGVARPRIGRLAVSDGTVVGGFDPTVGTTAGAVTAMAFAPGRIALGGGFSGFGPYSTANFALFDLVPPTVTLTAPADGARFRRGQTIKADFSCAEEAGGPVDCVGDVASGAPIDTATAGAKTFTVTATDEAGNTVKKTANYVVDGSAPSIAITSPGAGASYVAGSTIPIAFTCTDEDGPDDVASCAGSQAPGSKLVASGVGDKTFAVTATDKVGNTTTKTIAYAVAEPALAPALTAFKLTPARFRQRTKVTFKLSLPAKVTFKITYRQRRKTARTFTRTGVRGVNRFTLKRGRLKPDRYKLIARATGSSGRKSAPVARVFKILKR